MKRCSEVRPCVRGGRAGVAVNRGSTPQHGNPFGIVGEGGCAAVPSHLEQLQEVLIRQALAEREEAGHGALRMRDDCREFDVQVRGEPVGRSQGLRSMGHGHAHICIVCIAHMKCTSWMVTQPV